METIVYHINSSNNNGQRQYWLESHLKIRQTENRVRQTRTSVTMFHDAPKWLIRNSLLWYNGASTTWPSQTFETWYNNDRFLTTYGTSKKT